MQKIFKIFLVTLAGWPLWVAAQAIEVPVGADAPQIIRGTDQVLAPPSTAGQITGASAGIKFEDAPIADVVSLVLREIAKVNYVLHPPLNGTVTLSTQGPVSAD